MYCTEPRHFLFNRAVGDREEKRINNFALRQLTEQSLDASASDGAEYHEMYLFVSSHSGDGGTVLQVLWIPVTCHVMDLSG